MMRLVPESPYDDIDELLSEHLPSPPDSWVERAVEMPQFERALAALEESGDGADDDALRAALEQVGLEPDEERMRALRMLQRKQGSQR